MRTSHILLCCAALILSACNSGSAEVDESPPPASPAPPEPSPPPPTPPTPPAPTPPAPTPPPPAPGNEPPRADAGSDKSTVEEQDVTIDGSDSRDPENRPLTYAWSLVSAPEGSGLAMDARSETFAFRPDVPGTYDLQLTVSDGSSTDTDTVRVRAEALVAFREGGSFKVERRGDDDDDDEKHRRPIELELRTSEFYRGSRVPFTVSTDAPWLRALELVGITASRGEEAELHVVLVMDEVDRLPKGEHEAHVIVTLNGGWERAQARVTLKIEGGDDKISPYVSYTDQPSTITLYGSGLTAAADARVFLDDIDVGPLSVTSETEAAIALPALAAGEHTLRIGADGEAIRVFVRDLPVHSAADVPLAGTASSLEYDAERDAFYGIFVAADGTRSAHRLRNTGTGAWVADVIAVGAARDVALTADGADLLVSADGCLIHRLDPQTLALRESLSDASCSADEKSFGALTKLVDGQPVAIADAMDPTLFAYPEGSRTVVPLPNIASFEFAEGMLHVRELR
jgi:hypothetical protein